MASGVAVGQSSRWTDSASAPFTLRCTASATNGQNGERMRLSVLKVWWSVSNAAWSPDQKRRRLRRTYQFESSSMNAEMSWTARWDP